MGDAGGEGSLLEPAESQFFDDVIGASQRKGTRSQLGAAGPGLYQNYDNQ